MKLFVSLCVVVAAACGGHGAGDIDEVVGASCTSDRDCAHRCFQDSDLPDGFCSLSCVTDNDCPIDTYCMSESGGMCMFACPPFDCSRLGAGWFCRDRGRRNGGSLNVCSGG